jgi:predicted RNase H-like nuclease (RuvC/YqgF family)
LASAALDAAAQARENLRNFRAFLEGDPGDPAAALLAVTQSFSGALTALRGQTADLQSKTTEAQAAATDLDGQEAENTARRTDYAARLAGLREERAALARAIEQLRLEGERLEREIATGKALKAGMHEKTDEFTGRSRRLADLEKELMEESAHTVFLQQEAGRLRLEIEGQGQQAELDLANSQARVRDLTLEAKKAELEEKRSKMQAKKKKLLPLLLTPDVSAFVIEDRVKISEEDTETLRFMIDALQEENAKLIEERNDRMMDVDCLMQENVGLKQLIRQISEGA